MCGLCGAPGHRRLIARRHGIHRCSGCGHQYAEHQPAPDHTARTFDDGYFFGGGAGYPDYLAEADLVRERGRRYADRLARWFAPGELLDVGAAAGFLMEGFAQRGWRCTGLEPNRTMAARARGRGLDVIDGTLEGYPGTRRFDLVVMVQVLAHLVDLRRALAVAAEATRPGGAWLVETWNPESWTARLLRGTWHEYSPPAALHFLSPATLDRATASLGFQRIGFGRVPVRWIGAAHARSLLRHVLAGRRLGRLASLAAWIPERARLPYVADDLYWAVYQKRA